MLATKIPGFLKSFYSEDSSYRTVLLDGKWGCGKTYGIRRFLEDQEVRPNCIYISLFGAKSANEIVLKLAEKLESDYIVEMGGEYYIADTPYDMDYNNTLIIFDDLERIAQGLKYESICGVVDSLRKSGFKIACIACSEEVTDKKHFLQFREKTFDSVINISEDSSVLSEIVPELGLSSGDVYLKIANGNWRLLMKASKACSEIMAFMKKRKKEDYLKRMKLDNSTFFRCVLLAEKCIFSKNEKVPSFSEDEDYKKWSYNEDVEEFGASVANELYAISQGDDREYIGEVERFVRSILINDYYQLIYHYYPNIASGILDEPPFNEEPYFLGDTGKRHFKVAFFKRINDFDFSENIQARFLINFLKVFADTLTDKEINILSKRIVDTVSTPQNELFSRMLFLDARKQPKVGLLRNQIDKLFSEKEERKTKAQLNNAFKRGDYSALTDFLYKNRFSEEREKETIAEIFASKGFFLPDLSKEIDYLSWQYCHEIANFVSDLDKYKKSFIDCLLEQCKHSPSKTLRERCRVLVVANKMTENPFDLFIV